MAILSRRVPETQIEPQAVVFFGRDYIIQSCGHLRPQAADGEGFDTSAETSEKQASGKKAKQKPKQFSQIDTDVAAIAAAWPSLPDALKAGILAMVQAAKAD